MEKISRIETSLSDTEKLKEPRYRKGDDSFHKGIIF